MIDEVGKTPAPSQPPVTPPAAVPAEPVVASLDDFKKLQFKIGKVVTAAVHPNADKLLVLTVDIGEAIPRQVVAGIRVTYQPETLIGKEVVVVVNLKPATLRGVESQGMILAASDPTGMSLVSPDRELPPGSQVK